MASQLEWIGGKGQHQVVAGTKRRGATELTCKAALCGRLFSNEQHHPATIPLETFENLHYNPNSQIPSRSPECQGG